LRVSVKRGMMPLIQRLYIPLMAKLTSSIFAASVSDQATAWFTRLQAGALDAAERQRFDAWLQAAPEHAAAFEQTRRLWALLEVPAAQVHAKLSAQPTAAVPLRRPPRFRPAAACCLLALLALGAPRLPVYYQNWQSDYCTAPGERLTVSLEDGSRLTLNTDSALAVRFSSAQRRIELLRGEAYFEVAPNRVRPFVVSGGGAEARAVGTAFSVDRQHGAVRVVVSEGVVEVSAAGAEARLPAARQVAYRDGRLEPVQNAEVDTALAWRHGQVAFNRRPLAQVLDEVNRYRRGRIVAVNPALAGRIVSGVFDAADPAAVVEALQSTLHARAVDIPGGWVLLY
jgi:transmembrane sensor